MDSYLIWSNMSLPEIESFSDGGLIEAREKFSEASID